SAPRRTGCADRARGRPWPRPPRPRAARGAAAAGGTPSCAGRRTHSSGTGGRRQRCRSWGGLEEEVGVRNGPDDLVAETVAGEAVLAVGGAVVGADDREAAAAAARGG